MDHNVCSANKVTFWTNPYAKHVLNFSQTVCNAMVMDRNVCNVQIIIFGTLNNAKSVLSI